MGGWFPRSFLTTNRFFCFQPLTNKENISMSSKVRKANLNKYNSMVA